MEETKMEGAKWITFVSDEGYTSTYNLPDKRIEDLLPKIGAEAVLAEGCHMGFDTWHKEGELGEGNCYHLLNPNQKKLDEYLSKCEVVEEQK